MLQDMQKGKYIKIVSGPEPKEEEAKKCTIESINLKEIVEVQKTWTEQMMQKDQKSQ